MKDHVESKGSLSGETYSSVGNGKPPKQKSKDRICTEPECDTRLSVYNDSDRCSIHPRDNFKATIAVHNGISKMRTK